MKVTLKSYCQVKETNLKLRVITFHSTTFWKGQY